MRKVLSYLDRERARHLDELAEFLTIPSISTVSDHRADIDRAAGWVADQLAAAGLQHVAVNETDGHPVVTGQTPPVPDAPTVLIYGHYDVQPAEPLEHWRTPPFTATVVGRKLFARGAADDKGQLFLYLKVLEAFHQVHGRFPLNVKVLAEGEEEIGSPSLVPFLKRHKQRLSCDVVLVSDTNMLGIRTPSITCALRGMVCFELTVRTASGDLHSGSFGGAIANPVQVLAELLVGCKDPKSGRVRIPGFYQDVRRITPKQKQSLAQIPHDDARFARSVGAPSVFGERGKSTLERMGARPTFEVNGIRGGYAGEGIKTVLPCEAQAKVSMRLVADQKPAKIARLFREHIARIAPSHAKVTVRKLDNDAHPSLVDPGFPAMAVAAGAVERVFGRAPLFAMEGGSIPIVAEFKRALGAETILLGFGLPDDNIHAPNEKIDLRMVDKGMKTIARLFDQLGAGPS